jgi:hypothetical protein
MRDRFRVSLLIFILVAAGLFTHVHAGLIHRFSFNDGSAKDSVGKSDGTLLGGAKIANGQLVMDNEGQSSDGAQISYLEFASPILPASGSATLMVWFTAKKEAGDFARLVNIGDHDSGRGVNFVYITAHTNTDKARCAIGTDSTTRIPVDNDRLDDDQEHMLTMVIDGDAKKLHVYVDGKESAAAENLGENTLDKVKQVDRWLGRSSFDRDPGLCGSINEFRVYDHALNADEISAANDVGADALPATSAPTTQPANKK